MDLFTQLEDMNKQVPLAELMRPKTLEEFLELTKKYEALCNDDKK